MKKIASGVTTLYHYAGGNLIAETDENGISQRDYIYLNGEPAALRIYGAQFGTMYYFVNDHLGTPQKIADGTGSVVWAAAYFPFGKAQIKPETITNNLRFPGQYYDAESGLHYNWNRYYDPDTGRYITADPIGLSGGINLYAYVMNNPVNLVDPTGLFLEGNRVVPIPPDTENFKSCVNNAIIDYYDCRGWLIRKCFSEENLSDYCADKLKRDIVSCIRCQPSPPYPYIPEPPPPNGKPVKRNPKIFIKW